MLNSKELETIISLQRQLDDKIAQSKGIANHQITTLTARFLALIVEISEFANEQRCFKYWSFKPASKKSILLEEYIDGLHFIISIANSLGLDPAKCDIKLQTYQNLNLAFLELFDTTLKLFHQKSLTILNTWFNIYYTIANLCNFSSSDIFEGYLVKNKINHLRQEQAY